jgi:cobalt/nickel transport system permease protein
MIGVHVLIGVGEALITVAALAFITATRPDLLALRDARADERLGAAAQGA